MYARHASRELALLYLFQHDRQGALDGLATAATEANFAETAPQALLGMVRALTDNAIEDISQAGERIAHMQQVLIAAEADSPDNLERPVDAEVVPVELPNTEGFRQELDALAQSVNRLADTARLPELYALCLKHDVTEYATQILTAVAQHHAAIDETIQNHSDDWRIDRMMKLDRCVLRMAVGEMLYLNQVDDSVVIDEAVELAKSYGEPDSYKLINGVLGGVATEIAGAKGLPA